MQLQFPVYGVEGEEAAFANRLVANAINSDESALLVGHLVVFEPQKGSCKKLSKREQIESCSLGIVLWDGNRLEYESSGALRILRRGRVYVHLYSDVSSAGEAVFVNFRTGGFGGKETAETMQLTQAFFLSAGKTGDVILLELDLLREDLRDEDYQRTWL